MDLLLPIPAKLSTFSRAGACTISPSISFKIFTRFRVNRRVNYSMKHVRLESNLNFNSRNSSSSNNNCEVNCEDDDNVEGVKNVWEDNDFVEVFGIGSRKDALLDFCLASPSLSTALRFCSSSSSSNYEGDSEEEESVKNVCEENDFVEVFGIGSRKDALLDFCLASPCFLPHCDFGKCVALHSFSTALRLCRNSSSSCKNCEGDSEEEGCEKNVCEENEFIEVFGIGSRNDALLRLRFLPLCDFETKWVGSKARDVDGYKLWYSGSERRRNRVGILVDEELRGQVVEVKRISDRLMTIKWVIGGFTLNVCSAYAPQVGLDGEEKMRFWEALDDVVRGVPSSEKIVVAGDFNGHIGALPGGFVDVHGGFGFGERNEEGATLLDFVRSFGLVVVNSGFPKKDDHLITFRSAIAKTQIDFLLLREGDRVLCKDCKVIPSENLSTQHRLLVMDLGIKKDRKRRGEECKPRIKWGGLTPVNAWEIGEKLAGMRVWEYRWDVDSMWNRVARCIRENASEVLGVSRGRAGHHRGISGGIKSSSSNCDGDSEEEESVKNVCEENEFVEVFGIGSRKDALLDFCFALLSLSTALRFCSSNCQRDSEEEEAEKNVCEESEFVEMFGIGSRKDALLDFCVALRSEAVRRMRRGRAMGPDKISVDFWKFSGEAGLRWLTGLFNDIFKSAKMPEAWR
ncbi:hypothetical protein FXO37_04202 [Capsicum annuum]|nr:hypothetical protein FXO37_04202 [Capsicum annuum]